MGERVRVGPFTYSVLEGKWATTLNGDPSGRIPTNRYLIIRLSVTNSGAEETSFPMFTVVSANGQESGELIEGASDVPNWFAPLSRTLKPAQSVSGSVVFDVPLGHYKFKIEDGSDPEHPHYATVDVPVQIE